MPSTILLQGNSPASTSTAYLVLRDRLRSAHGDTLRSSASITTEDSCTITFRVEDLTDGEVAAVVSSVELEDCTATVLPSEAAKEVQSAETSTAAVAPSSAKRRRRTV